MFGRIPPLEFLSAQLLVLFLAIGIHEYAHCKFADLAGDPTPRYYGRVTLNLFKHFEPIGTMMMVITSLAGFGIGWGRAAPADPSKMRNPRWDFFTSVLAGPMSNLIQAFLFAIILRLTLAAGAFNGMPVFAQYFLLMGVLLNLAIMCFNLIPFGPLDGHWLVGLLMPERPRLTWFQFNRGIGMFGLFIAVILLQRAGISITRGPVEFFFARLTGVRLQDIL